MNQAVIRFGTGWAGLPAWSRCECGSQHYGVHLLRIEWQYPVERASDSRRWPWKQSAFQQKIFTVDLNRHIEPVVVRAAPK